MHEFLINLFINLFKLLIICLPLEILGWIILLPICFCSKSNKLPVFVRWYDNADLYIGRDTTTSNSVLAQGFFARYLWLAFRNPLNYFGYKVLGFLVTQERFAFTTNTAIPIGDSQGKEPGLLITKSSDIYEYYYIHKWSATKCFRFRMGWKIGIPWMNQKGDWIQWVFVIQPYKSYTGI